MSQTLKIPNFSDLNIVDQTQLTGAAPKGSSSLPVENALNNFSGGVFVLIGTAGSKLGEIAQAGLIESANTIPVNTNTLLDHRQFDPVYALFADQLRVYRALDDGNGDQPADSAFNFGTPYAQVPIDPSNSETEYTDPTGGPLYWYKVTYYNSSSGAESDIGSAVAVRGNFTVNYCSLDEIRNEAGFKFARYVTDDEVDQKRRAAQDEINGALDEFYQTPLQPPINDYLRNICIRLAGGLLRQAQYSSVSNPQVNGKSMYEAAQADLKRLITKQRILVDKNGRKLDSPGAAGGIEGWPNSSTAQTQASQGGAPRVFRMSDIQGRPITSDDSGQPVGNSYYGRRW